MRSILASSDGASPAGAFEIVYDREIYVTMTALGLPYFAPEVAYSDIFLGGDKYERVVSRGESAAIQIGFPISGI